MAKKTMTMDEEVARDLGLEKALTVEEVSIINSFKFHQLPSDIFFDILTRLSIETLVTLKTVSKWWNNSLENQKLAHELISISLKDSSRNGILTMSYDDDNSSSTLKFLFSNNEGRPKVIHHAPFETKDSNEFRFVNCCNGLICFAKNFEGMDQIFICNPVTKEVISLPNAKKSEHQGRVTYGLGFSPATEEYKVIGFVRSNTVKTKVFTLGTSSSWRDIASEPIHPYYGKSIYANGALHWKLDPLWSVSLCTDDNIMSFDIEKEEFYIMKDPKLGTAMCERMDLIQVGGCLGVVHRSFRDHIDIWVMKDNIKKQWVKEYVLKVQPPSNFEFEWRRNDNVAFRIIGLWQQGEIFMAWKIDSYSGYDPPNWEGYNFFSYDPKTDGKRDIHCIIEPGPSTIITKVVCGYTMSLVSLKPYGYKKR